MDGAPPAAPSSSAGSTGEDRESPRISEGEYGAPLSPSSLQVTPVLVEAQIQRISDTAKEIVKALPEKFESKQPNNKKKISKEVEEIHKAVVAMDDSDPKKMEDIRKFSAIYGRFDCKRKPQKPLTLHEVGRLEEQLDFFANAATC